MHGAGITVVGGPVRCLTLDEPLQLAPDEVVIDVYAAGVGNWDELVGSEAGGSAAHSPAQGD